MKSVIGSLLHKLRITGFMNNCLAAFQIVDKQRLETEEEKRRRRRRKRRTRKRGRSEDESTRKIGRRAAVLSSNLLQFVI